MLNRTLKLCLRQYRTSTYTLRATILVQPDCSPLLNCCKESRQETIRLYMQETAGTQSIPNILPPPPPQTDRSLQFVFNFSRDTFSFEDPQKLAMFRQSTQYLLNGAGVQLAKSIRHLMIERCAPVTSLFGINPFVVDEGITIDMMKCLGLFEKLESLTISEIVIPYKSQAKSTREMEWRKLPWAAMRKKGIKKVVETTQALLDGKRAKNPNFDPPKIQFLYFQ